MQKLGFLLKKVNEGIQWSHEYIHWLNEGIQWSHEYTHWLNEDKQWSHEYIHWLNEDKQWSYEYIHWFNEDKQWSHEYTHWLNEDKQQLCASYRPFDSFLLWFKTLFRRCSESVGQFRLSGITQGFGSY